MLDDNKPTTSVLEELKRTLNPVPTFQSARSNPRSERAFLHKPDFGELRDLHASAQPL